MMTRFFLIVLASLMALCGASVAHADLVDVRVAREGADYNLWLIFDRPAQSVSVLNPAEGVRFDIGGTQAAAGRYELVNAGEVSMLQFEPHSRGVRVTLPGTWQNVGAEVQNGAVVLAVTGTGREVATPTQMALPAVSTTASTPEQTSRESTESVVNSTLNAARSEGCEVTERRVQEAAWDVGGLADHANCLLDLGNQTAASRILQQAIALEPNHFESLYALAEIRLGRGDRQGARVLYQQAYQAARGDAQALAARRALRDLSR